MLSWLTTECMRQSFQLFGTAVMGLGIDTRYAQEVLLEGLRLFPVSKIVVTSIYIGPKRFLTRFKPSSRSKNEPLMCRPRL